MGAAMTHIQGYTSQAAIQRLRIGNVDVPANVQTAIQQMEALHITAAPAGAVGAAAPATILGRADLGLKKEIREEESAQIAMHLNPKATSTLKLMARLQNKADAKMLKGFMSFDPKGPKVNSSQRAARRAALCLAFGHGAGKEELRTLKAHLDAPEAGRLLTKYVIDQLKKPDVDVKAFVDSLGWPGQSALSNAELNYLSRTNRAGQQAMLTKKPQEFVTTQQDIYKNKHVPVFRSITDYTNEGFVVNAQLKSGNLDEAGAHQVKVMDFALAQLPDWKGMTARGAELTDEQISRYVVGETITERFFMSTSADRGFGGNTQFIVQVETGKDVSALSRGNNKPQDGREILIPRNAQFKVLAHQQVRGKTMIVLSEAI